MSGMTPQDTAPVDPGPPWHALRAQEVLERLGASAAGLDAGEAAARRARYGSNRLAAPVRRGPLARFLAQFHDTLIYVLLGAAALTLALRHWVDAGVILGVVVINALIGFVQEGKAQRALDAVRGLLAPRATVLRAGRSVEIPAADLVPGDIVLLQPGDRVPADLRLIHARLLQIDEAVLTGESQVAAKEPGPVASQAPLAERRDMAYAGTLVLAGQGRGVVVATGETTEVGRIGALLREVQPLTTPLLRQMAVFGRRLSAAILAIAGATLWYGIWRFGHEPAGMFLAAVGLAVAAIPEGLPAILTITLAIGVQRMARRNAIVRRLPAVETLGAVSVICSDKTGTLTRNEMTVQAVATAEGDYEVGGVGYDAHGGFARAGVSIEASSAPELLELARVGVLCNDAAVNTAGGTAPPLGDPPAPLGDPMEIALWFLAAKAGLDPEGERAAHPRRDTIPFDARERLMATLHHDRAGHAFVCVKGAPERLLALCTTERAQGTGRPLDPRRWHARTGSLADAGLRVLALAFAPLDAERTTLHLADLEGGLTLLGLVGIVDPPRPEALAAVARCRRAGIRVKMITGDHAATAGAVARRFGIAGNTVLTGPELDALDDAALDEAARRTDVFARAAPEHKLRLVQALQRTGAVVAMTGDGVNDAPALRRADVGIAMGRKGTEAAKEAAEVVLADDNFASIAAAVEEGRTVYDNLRKAIQFILPTNAAQAAMIVVAVLLGRPLPITPLQILWVNLITAVTLALALAFEPAEDAVMHRRPRAPDEPLLSAFLLWRIAFVSLLLVAASYGLFLWERGTGAPLETARTVAVNALMSFEAFYLLAARRFTRAALGRGGLAGGRYALLAIALALALQGLFTYAPPLQALFGSDALDAAHWARIAVAGGAILLLVELEKRLLRGRRNA